LDRNSTSTTVNPKMKMSKEELGLEETHNKNWWVVSNRC